jgi:hypothetical protein
VIAVSGSFALGFSLAIAGSFQVFTEPRKMSASTAPLRVSSLALIPGRLNTATTPPITAGNCSRPFLFRSSPDIGSSDAPKSTVFEVICLTPPPEPIAW